MSDSLNQNEVRKYLSAFADGELDVEQNLKVLEQIAMDPATTRRVIHQQQLRQAVHRCLADPCHCPDALRAKLAAALAAEATPPGAGVADRAVIGRVGRWAPLAVAATLILGTMVLLLEGGRGTPPETFPGAGASASAGAFHPGAGAGASLLPPDQLATFSQRHVRCANSLAQLFRTDEFPPDVTALPAAVADHVGRQVASALNLADIGYRYDVAGVCTIPGRNAVHILYRAAPDSGRADRLSLWIRPADDTAPPLAPGRIYIAADTNQPHPMLLWQEDGLIYYLMGDAGDRVQLAAATLRDHG